LLISWNLTHSSPLIQAANRLFAHHPNARRDPAIREFDQFKAWRQALQAAHPGSAVVHYAAQLQLSVSGRVAILE
jgi:hypothetical protein